MIGNTKCEIKLKVAEIEYKENKFNYLYIYLFLYGGIYRYYLLFVSF